MAAKPLSVDRALARARTAARQGDRATALGLYREVLERFPKNRPALEGLAALLAPGHGDPLDAAAFLMGNGRPAEARALAEPLVLQRPKSPVVLGLLGAARAATGAPIAAIEALGAALALAPDDPALHFGLGVARMATGDATGAVAAYTAALARAPDHAEARFNLGIAQHAAGDAGAAVASFRTALAALPGYAEGHLNLGAALKDTGDMPGAIDSYRTALRLSPGLAEAQVNLGVALKEAGDLPGAIDSYRAALARRPKDAGAHYNLGLALREANDHPAAIEAQRAALALDPAFTEAHLALGNALRDIGEVAAARAEFEAALTLRPDYAEAHENLAQVKTFAPDDPQIAEIEALLAAPATDARARRMLAFALAKARDDLGETDAAFARLIEANRLRKAELGYDIAADRALFARLGALPAASPLAVTEARPRPILIVGLPRSGTTLVEQILASHSAVHGAGELSDLGRAAEAALGRDAPTAPESLAALRATYLAALAGHGGGAAVVTDKMPLNFRWLGLALAALPEARVIHTMRDPRATCWSIFRQDFAARGNGYGYDLDDLAAYHALYRDLMALSHARFPGRILDLSYEALTEDQEGETRRLLNACGLPWEDACLDFHQTRRAVTTASAGQVRRKLYRGSSDDWRRYGDHLDGLCRALGTP